MTSNKLPLYIISKEFRIGNCEMAELYLNYDAANKRLSELDLFPLRYPYKMDTMNIIKENINDVIHSIYIVTSYNTGIWGSCLYVNKDDAIMTKSPKEHYKSANNEEVFEYKFDEQTNCYRYTGIIDEDDVIFDRLVNNQTN